MIIKKLYHCLLIVCLATGIAITIPSAYARKIRTKHSIPKNTKTESSVEAGKSDFHTVSMRSDSIAFCDSILPLIRFYGFDKTVSSNIESFFISNGLDREISGLDIIITYTDMKGRQLHKRSAHLDCNVPPGETKRHDIKSWDTQKSFYFHKSVRPKRQATPFDVKLRLLSVTLQKAINTKDPE